MECELSDDPAQATRISGRIVSFPDVTAQRVLRVSHWTSTRLHGVGPPFAITHCRDGGRQPNAASCGPSSFTATWMVCCAAWTAFTLRRRSCTLKTARWLPWVRTAVHVLRQCHLPCPLWPHGLPSTAR
ncbi:hypothetical protein TcCL_ESM10424 [Trypanosoma cruzi]|nr:hypothetical protein TcCL_ESM10424 [Trypanosoma cruzi]